MAAGAPGRSSRDRPGPAQPIGALQVKARLWLIYGADGSVLDAAITGGLPPAAAAGLPVLPLIEVMPST